MATFIVLASFSDQGIKNIKQSIERADAFKQMAVKVGATVKDIYWTQGSRDIVDICEAPDDETATTLALSVAARGNVRSETLGAFSLDEMRLGGGFSISMMLHRTAGAGPGFVLGV